MVKLFLNPCPKVNIALFKVIDLLTPYRQGGKIGLFGGAGVGKTVIMMELLAKLAKEGRTILLVTHATNNINLCDRLVFLGQGGNLCYFGSPGEALNLRDEA